MAAEYSISLDPRHVSQDSGCSSSLCPCSPHRSLLVLSTTGFNPLKALIKIIQLKFTLAFTSEARLLHLSDIPARQLLTSKPTQQADLQHKRPVGEKKVPSSSSPKGLPSTGSQPGAPARETYKQGTLFCSTAYTKAEGWNQSFSGPEPW